MMHCQWQLVRTRIMVSKRLQDMIRIKYLLLKNSKFILITFYNKWKPILLQNILSRFRILMKSRHLAKCLDRQQVGVVKNDLKIFDVKLTILNIFKSKSACVYTRLSMQICQLWIFHRSAGSFLMAKGTFLKKKS